MSSGAAFVLWGCPLVLSACRGVPEPENTEAPEINLSQVGRGVVEVFESTHPDVRATMPAVFCPGGRTLPRHAWEVAAFPIEVLVSASDPTGVEWLRLGSEGGILSAAQPSSVILGRGAGGEVYSAEMTNPASERLTVRSFRVSLDLQPGAKLVLLEGEARDYGGKIHRAPAVSVGTLDALCDGFRD